MKARSLTLSGLFILSVCSLARAETAQPNLSSAKDTAWNSAYGYIVANATSIDSNALNLLRTDVYAGVVTWTLNGRDPGGTGLKMDGGYMGWPNIQQVATFPTNNQAIQASNLVLAATATSQPKAR